MRQASPVSNRPTLTTPICFVEIKLCFFFFFASHRNGWAMGEVNAVEIDRWATGESSTIWFRTEKVVTSAGEAGVAPNFQRTMAEEIGHKNHSLVRRSSRTFNFRYLTSWCPLSLFPLLTNVRLRKTNFNYFPIILAETMDTTSAQQWCRSARTEARQFVSRARDKELIWFPMSESPLFDCECLCARTRSRVHLETKHPSDRVLILFRRTFRSFVRAVFRSFGTQQETRRLPFTIVCQNRRVWAKRWMHRAIKRSTTNHTW